MTYFRKLLNQYDRYFWLTSKEYAHDLASWVSKKTKWCPAFLAAELVEAVRDCADVDKSLLGGALESVDQVLIRAGKLLSLPAPSLPEHEWRTVGRNNRSTIRFRAEFGIVVALIFFLGLEHWFPIILVAVLEYFGGPVHSLQQSAALPGGGANHILTDAVKILGILGGQECTVSAIDQEDSSVTALLCALGDSWLLTMLSSIALFVLLVFLTAWTCTGSVRKSTKNFTTHRLKNPKSVTLSGPPVSHDWKSIQRWGALLATNSACFVLLGVGTLANFVVSEWWPWVVGVVVSPILWTCIVALEDSSFRRWMLGILVVGISSVTLKRHWEFIPIVEAVEWSTHLFVAIWAAVIAMFWIAVRRSQAIQHHWTVDATILVVAAFVLWNIFGEREAPKALEAMWYPFSPENDSGLQKGMLVFGTVMIWAILGGWASAEKDNIRLHRITIFVGFSVALMTLLGDWRSWNSEFVAIVFAIICAEVVHFIVLVVGGRLVTRRKIVVSLKYLVRGLRCWTSARPRLILVTAVLMLVGDWLGWSYVAAVALVLILFAALIYVLFFAMRGPVPDRKELIVSPKWLLRKLRWWTAARPIWALAVVAIIMLLPSPVTEWYGKWIDYVGVLSIESITILLGAMVLSPIAIIHTGVLNRWSMIGSWWAYLVWLGVIASVVLALVGLRETSGMVRGSREVLQCEIVILHATIAAILAMTWFDKARHWIAGFVAVGIACFTALGVLELILLAFYQESKVLLFKYPMQGVLDKMQLSTLPGAFKDAYYLHHAALLYLGWKAVDIVVTQACKIGLYWCRLRSDLITIREYITKGHFQ